MLIPRPDTQSFQKSLVEEYVLNHIGILNMVWGIFLNKGLLEDLGTTGIPETVVGRIVMSTVQVLRVVTSGYFSLTLWQPSASQYLDLLVKCEYLSPKSM